MKDKMKNKIAKQVFKGVIRRDNLTNEYILKLQSEKSEDARRQSGFNNICKVCNCAS